MNFRFPDLRFRNSALSSEFSRMDNADFMAMVPVPIPRIFFDYVIEAPIRKCLLCERDLLEADVLYMVEKAIKEPDVLYEFAVCLPCMQKSQQMISPESAENIQAFFVERVNLRARARKLLAAPPPFTVDDWLTECLVTGKLRTELREYTIYGLFLNDKILLGELPYLISADALVEIASLLSQTTKDEMGRFSDENLGVPPEFEDLFRKRTPLLF